MRIPTLRALAILVLCLNGNVMRGYSVLTHEQVIDLAWEERIQPLLLKRSKEGIRSSFIDQEQLFDYYNYGRYGPAGIQNAVRSVHPQYLLLLGRTTYDYRNYSGLNVDPLCPSFLVSTPRT